MESRQIINGIKTHLGFESDSQLAVFLGVKPNTISTWATRNTLDAALIIAKCDDIDANWLLTGTGPMLRRTDHDCHKNNNAQLVEEPGVQYNAQETWSMISKAVQAATEAARAATEMARDIHLLIHDHAGRIEASETMVQALQEFVAERFAENENKTLQEVRAVLGNKVIDVANRKKKGTRHADSTSDKVS